MNETKCFVVTVFFSYAGRWGICFRPRGLSFWRGRTLPGLRSSRRIGWETTRASGRRWLGPLLVRCQFYL